MLGQALGLPLAIPLYSFLGVAIWDAVVVLGQFHQSLLASVARVALVVATLNTNVAANVVSPSNCFSNLNPKLISFRAGGLITGVVGIAMMLWKLLGNFSACIFGWFEGYSGLLRPIAGGMIADYFLIRNRSSLCLNFTSAAASISIRTASTTGRWQRSVPISWSHYLGWLFRLYAGSTISFGSEVFELPAPCISPS